MLVTIFIVNLATPALANSQQDQSFLQRLKQPNSALENVQGLHEGTPDESKIEAVHFACKSLKRGVKLEELNLLGLQKHNPTASAREYINNLTRVGVEVYCPEYQN